MNLFDAKLSQQQAAQDVKLYSNLLINLNTEYTDCVRKYGADSDEAKALAFEQEEEKVVYEIAKEDAQNQYTSMKELFEGLQEEERNRTERIMKNR